jgi:predicted GIY-YIG superfamily endonuclease
MVPGFNLKEAIVEALTALGGSGSASEVRQYIKSKYGKDWKDIKTIMDDLCVESNSSFFPPEDRVLKCIEPGKYSLKAAVISEVIDTETLAEEPKISAGLIPTTFENTVALYSEKLKQIFSQPILRFGEATSAQVPEESGVYIIHDRSSNQIIYAGRSRNLRRRLLQQHKRGNIEGSRFRKALVQKLNLESEMQITDYVSSNCSFQFLAVDSFEEMVRLEHFVTAILAPTLNTELKQ